ncbi:MAG: OmpA family protein [Acetobacteraceae bacterium]|nr:OmpA family protein [Acetobacteraceae bacterium]
MRIAFAPNRVDLSPESEQALKDLANSRPKGDGVSFDVRGYAAGTVGDPSMARRLSLSRSLAVRNVLIAEGINSAQIYVRALGSNLTGEPADRVDVTLSGTNSAASK